MKLAKGFAIATAVGLLWGCDTNGEGGGEIQAEAAEVLSENCESCHVEGGSGPMPITNCDDILAATPTDSDTTVYAEIETRINDEADPMPPSGLLPEDERDTLNDWIDDGVPDCE